jgi:hypothetical protein
VSRWAVLIIFVVFTFPVAPIVFAFIIVVIDTLLVIVHALLVFPFVIQITSFFRDRRHLRGHKGY